MTKGEETRLKILRCAIEELGSLGLHLATLDKISKRAKVPKPLIVHYFGNKTSLLIAAIELVLQDFAGIAASVSNDDQTGMEKIHAILSSNLLLAKKFSASTRLIIMLYSGATWDDEFKELYEKVTQSARGRYAAAMKSAAREKSISDQLDFESLSRGIHFWIIGAIIDFLQSGATPSAERRIKDDWSKWILPLLGHPVEH